MEAEEQNNIYAKYDSHVNAIREYLRELWNEFSGIRNKKMELSQKLSEQIDEIAQLQMRVEQLLSEQKEKQDQWKRLATELYLLKKQVPTQIKTEQAND
ncbi:hypothetical protein EHI8A_054040 [Entamoeba histolytica HM-1:IMSS-B]|uniref:Uncharacterized protein n=8 Tax=Entamoeba TaxID=5758 RepID=B1N413_ENTH1|nr:hypothetical protein EHI_032780 [Entamoeba histolytica HM-1:IMSS]XP_008855615.1 hypothetical protein ENU1_034690 [Entamoeba nuttalli P19]EMD47743.1 Hypothetical protein EHI5A_088920 [Entamoeba histolytica KU27]EMH76801.1 hypothetical protein EHI8A_054040 [Entamoeba histolytica HM-1:IMSS-B]EMS14910.1 hypothetical protein KM1_105260 [Entamoeba histolytica HM-3:IMSS]ENY65328.1 hypothetical protein EHI7A_054720 [Entamoeba histolytica HM-1:IMSS-A]GAT97258.1 hypothetical protein CL6EHI_032780 [E|eukprot:XP_008855615.1 hypothetical protein ENU1_034690 [Entamoeba nuttalli P19]